MADAHEVAECINEACHGFTFDDLGTPDLHETGPTITQNGVTHFDLDLGSMGSFQVTVSKTR